MPWQQMILGIVTADNGIVNMIKNHIIWRHQEARIRALSVQPDCGRSNQAQRAVARTGEDGRAAISYYIHER